ncbi:hypothetical protein [Bradyrhizobium japonicum]|uniref:hypothetical protein n=1 Tax=Bradyrhizobium japonicum TaxID=375 RepID=UPI001BA4D064|nr:hypothetical protein [Bradyrhizobium japonicum]MBR0914910.1 hypothetical protein [Bradyrhizobium japonicum]
MRRLKATHKRSHLLALRAISAGDPSSSGGRGSDNRSNCNMVRRTIRRCRSSALILGIEDNDLRNARRSAGRSEAPHRYDLGRR